MAISLLLVRHAAHADVGLRLTGRGAEDGLTSEGRAQAVALAEQLSNLAITAVYSSPRLRTRVTAAAVAERHDLSTVVAAELDEIDFGAWTGKSFAELAGDPQWDRWNAERGSARCPGGESMAEAVDRAAGMIDELARRHDGEQIALVTHCDIIRGLLCRAHGRSLDEILTFDVQPASVTTLRLGDAERAAA